MKTLPIDNVLRLAQAGAKAWVGAHKPFFADVPGLLDPRHDFMWHLVESAYEMGYIRGASAREEAR